MLKWIAVAAGVLVLVVVAVLAAVPWLLNTPALQAYVTQTVTHALGRPVKFASLSVSGFPLPTVRLRGLQIAEDPAFGPGPFLTVGEGKLGLRFGSLLRGRVEMTDLTLEEPRVELVEDRSGRWNVASLGAPAPGATPSPGSGGRVGLPSAGAVLLSRVHVVNGAFQYRREGGKAAAYQLEKVNLAMTQAGPGAELRLKGDALAQPGGVRLTLTEASLTPTGARSFAEASLRASIEVEAPDVAPLSATLLASPDVAGPMKGELRVTGTPAKLTATGAINFSRLVLSETQPRCGEPKRRQLVLDTVKIPVAYTPAQLDSRPVEATLGRGTITLQLGLALQSTPIATLKGISVKGLELAPVLVDYLCQPYAVTGPLDLTAEASMQPADVWRTTNGSGRLRIGPGRVVGQEMLRVVEDILRLAGVVSSALQPERRARDASSVLKFESITATYAVTNGVVRTNDLVYQAPDFRVEAAGTYALHNEQVVMNVTVTQGPNRFKGVISGPVGSLRIVPTGISVQEPAELKKLLEKLVR